MPEPRRDSPPPRFSSDEREQILRELRRVSDRVTELDRAVLSGREVTGTVHALTDEVRELSRDLRDMLARETSQERLIGQLQAQLQAVAARQGEIAGTKAGLDVGGAAGGAVAKEATSAAGTKWAVIAMLIAAATSGVIQGLTKAFESTAPRVAPPHHLLQAPHP